jgi:hypothetical protein
LALLFCLSFFNLLSSSRFGAGVRFRVLLSSLSCRVLL